MTSFGVQVVCVAFADEREDTMVEHHFDDEDEWLGPRVSSMTCHLNGLMMSEVSFVGLSFWFLNGNYA